MLKAAQNTSRQIREAEAQAVRTKVLGFRLDAAQRGLAVKERKVDQQQRMIEQNNARREMEQNWKRQIDAENEKKAQEIQAMKKEIKQKLYAKTDPAILSKKKEDFRRQKEIDEYGKAMVRYFQTCDEICIINNKRQFEAQKLRQLKQLLETEERQQREITRIRNQEIELNFGIGGQMSKRLEQEELQQSQVKEQLQKVRYTTTLTDMKLRKVIEKK